VLDQFGSTTEIHQFVQSGNEEGVEEFYGRKKQSPVLGGEGIRSEVMTYLGLMGDEHPRHERNRVRPPAERVMKVVAEEYGKGEEELRSSRREEANEGEEGGDRLDKEAMRYDVGGSSKRV